MPDLPVYELIGYAASMLIAVSLMMRSILKLRIINLIGALIFSIYGLLIQAYPVAAVNFFIVLIDLYYLVEIFTKREFFKLLEVKPDSDYLHYFLKFHDKEIRRFQPDFNFMPSGSQKIFFILRDVIPAGLVIGEIRGGDSLYVQLDYAISGYRDLRTARFVFQDSAPVLRENGITKVYSNPGTPSHQSYLLKMGFIAEKMTSGEVRYCLRLN